MSWGWKTVIPRRPMPSRNILLTLGYDGTSFSGFQIQKGERTVQGVLQDAILSLHGHSVEYHAAGRTDAGVHAVGQRINLHSDQPGIPVDRFPPALNGFLPRDVRVTAASEVHPEFHARYDARKRTYRYYLLPSDTPHPLYERFAWRVYWNLNLQALNRMAAGLVGTHDFTSFASRPEGSPVRTVYDAAFFPDTPFIVFQISASGFLWKMVRSVLGTMLGLRSGDPDEFKAILKAADRSLCGTTAPAWGLQLYHVEYNPEKR
jgi:tRNA pseudouridine38-40 synthase